MKLRPLLKEFRTLNPDFSNDLAGLDSEIDHRAKNYFQAIGIEVPLPLQVLCFNFCTSNQLEGRWLIQLDTGTGKTALCFTIACYYANQGHKVLIINLSEELTFRDFKKAQSSQNITNIPVNFIENIQKFSVLMEGISFVSFNVFSLIIKNSNKETLDNLVVIADEFDHIIFGENDTYSDAE
jgi:superfamily II DNA or RNA helicase